jgi:Trypsin-like peptidase domain
LDWNAIVERIIPSIVKIETPSGHGTGFLCFYNEDRTFVGIATAHHVIAHADRWQEPIRVTNYHTSTTVFLRESERFIWPDEQKDSAILLFSVGNLQLPQEPIELFPTDRRLPIGAEVGWLGYPALAQHTLCFFSGNVSAVWEFRNAYLIDGVAINGVSGGPVIYCTNPAGEGIQIVGSTSAYAANRATGETLPGLSIAQDVSHFQAMLSHIRTLDEANRQKAAAAATTQPDQVAQGPGQTEQQPQNNTPEGGANPADNQL